MTALPAAGVLGGDPTVGEFRTAIEQLRAVALELPDNATETSSPVLSGIAEVPSGYTRLDTGVVGTTDVSALVPGSWAPGQTIQIGTVAASRIVNLVTSGTGPGRIVLSGGDTELELSSLKHLVKLKLALNADVLEWREVSRHGYEGSGSESAAAASAAAAAGSASAAASSAGAAASSATASAASNTASGASATAAAASAAAASGAATEAENSKTAALLIAQQALKLPMARWTDASFPSGFRDLAAGDLTGKTVLVSGLSADRTLKLTPGLFTADTDDALAWVEIVNKTTDKTLNFATVSGAAVRPVVRWKDTWPVCLDTTTGAGTSYNFTVPLPAMNKGIFVAQVFALWSGLDSSGHELTAAWTSGLSGSLTRDFIFAWSGNPYRVPSYVFTYVPTSPIAATSAVLTITSPRYKLNGFLAFLWAVDETDGLHKIDSATASVEANTCLPVTSVSDFAANELALVAGAKRSNSLPGRIGPVSQLVWSGNTATATQSDPLFVLSGAAGWHDRGLIDESITYQASFDTGGSKHNATQAILLKPRSGGGSATSTLVGVTSVGPGKAAVLRAEPDGLGYIATRSA